MNTPPIIEHIEKNLGRISEKDSGTTVEIIGTKVHFLKFKNQPIESVTTICTCGLSKHIFSNSKGKLSQEVMFGYFSVYESDKWNALLSVICEDLLKTHDAFYLGQLYDVPGTLFPNKKFSALYCSFPAYYGDEIWKCNRTDPNTYFIWLFPVTEKEVEYIEKNGAESFEEDIVMIQQPRLFDLNRASLKV